MLKQHGEGNKADSGAPSPEKSACATSVEELYRIQGTTTVGERGQVVIPADVRKELGLNGGDRLVVFSESHMGAVIMVKADIINRIAKSMMSTLGSISEETQRILDDIDTVGKSKTSITQEKK